MVITSEIAKICKAEQLAVGVEYTISHLLTDSRKNFDPQTSLFFALTSAKADGHQFIAELHKRGCRNFVVSKDISTNELPGSNVFKVENVLLALQQLVTHKRNGWDGTMIAITGSNGKTIVKEWLHQLLAPHAFTLKSPGSYNSQLGVPLSVWNVLPTHQYAIIEAGISEKGEMNRLKDIIQPAIGIFTNIGSAHDQGFSDIKEKIREKLVLFSNVDTLIYCKDHEAIDREVKQQKIPSITWGMDPLADIRIVKESQINGSIDVSLMYKSKRFNFVLPFNQSIQKENVLHGLALLLFLGFNENQLQYGLRTLKPVAMRQSLRNGINGCQIIDDTYNNDLAGLEHALHFLQQQANGRQKTVILSDLLQTGQIKEKLYKRVSDYLIREKVDHVIGIGPEIEGQLVTKGKSVTYFKSTTDFLQAELWKSFANQIILIKGSRPFSFEKIVMALQERTHETRLEINFNHLIQNYSYFKTLLSGKSKIMVMVKALAYGTGKEVASLLQHLGVDYLGVAYADEGITLRNNGITVPIMVMNPTAESLPTMLAHQLEPEVYSINLLNQFIKLLHNQPLSIHIKLETGMNRLGIVDSEIDALLSILSENPSIKVASIFSHLAGADDPSHDEFTLLQAKRFYASAVRIKKELKDDPIIHLLNSAGITRFPKYHFDMVRLGIGLHGVNVGDDSHTQLLPVETFKTFISQIHEVADQESIGYGRMGQAIGKRKIATIAVGYADGFRRNLSRGAGKVLINGTLAPVIGNVCMDMTMVDVTDATAKEGDEVIIFGPSLPLEQHAEMVNTIPYEVLTGISTRVKRVFVYE